VAVATFPPLVFASETDKDVLRRARQRGALMRLASGIYSSETDKTPEDVVRLRLWQVVGHEMPDAVIVDRSARDSAGASGTLYVVADRKRPLRLPGVRVVPRAGVGHLLGDTSLPGGMWLASTARSLLENLAPTRLTAQGTSRTLTRAEVEAWVNELCAVRGENYLNRLRDEARELASQLKAEKELIALDALISAALTTRDDVPLQSPALQARASGEPFDTDRIRAFSRLAEYLETLPPDVVPNWPEDTTRRRLLPFYEAYFSNYIEGTEFTLAEAAEILFEHFVPAQRPQDAHDILGTYELTSSPEEMRKRPRDAEELLDQLQTRHAVILGGRPEMGPGRFKVQPNRAGSTVFVSPDKVVGTLRRGFQVGESLISPFARAVYVMFLVSEVHPFADGNGRVARIMMNSELEAAGEIRLIVPTVYRLNYLAGLKAATHTQNDAALVATLSFARRWTARVDFTSRQSAESDLERTNALRDAKDAEDAGVRLTLP